MTEREKERERENDQTSDGWNTQEKKCMLVK